MKKVLYSVVAIAAITLASCGGDSWSDSKKEEIVKECSEGGAPEKTCKCMVDKLAEKYDKPSEAEKALKENQDEAMKLAMECL